MRVATSDESFSTMTTPRGDCGSSQYSPGPSDADQISSPKSPNPQRKQRRQSRRAVRAREVQEAREALEAASSRVHQLTLDNQGIVGEIDMVNRNTAAVKRLNLDLLHQLESLQYEGGKVFKQIAESKDERIATERTQAGLVKSNRQLERAIERTIRSCDDVLTENSSLFKDSLSLRKQCRDERTRADVLRSHLMYSNACIVAALAVSKQTTESTEITPKNEPKKSGATLQRLQSPWYYSFCGIPNGR